MISGTPASALLTGHPALAARACSVKVASSIPGTFPTVTRSILEIGGLSVDGSQSDGGVRVDRIRRSACLSEKAQRAIEKQAAWAAAISCSGLDPGPSSKRDLKVYPPLIVSPALNVPVPVVMSPRHSALPFAAMSISFVVLRCWEITSMLRRRAKRLGA